MRKAAFAHFPLRDLWLPVVPFLPLLTMSVFLSGILSLPEKPKLGFLRFKFETEYVAKEAGLDYLHLGDFLNYFSIASLHVFVCIGVIGYFLYLMIRLPRRERSQSVVFFIGVSILTVALVLFLSKNANDIVLIQLGMKATCLAIDGANLATQLVEKGKCFDPDNISKFTLLVWIPTFLGMGAVAFAAAFAYGNASGLPSQDNPEWRTIFESRIKSLQRSVYALCAVLVSSTITVTLFASLPTNLFSNPNGALAKAVSGYVSGLGTFWGVLFTLTLVATFAAPAFRIVRRAYGPGMAAEESAQLRVWLRRHLFVSFRKQLGNVLVVLAPLLAGSVNSIFSFLAGK